MKHRIALCAGLAALGIAGAMSAQAQVYVEPPRGYDDPPRGYGEPPPDAEPPMVEPMVRPMFQPRLPPGEALMIVRAAGLRPLTRPAVRGSNYVLLASDNMGGQLRVMINGRNGRIMNAEPAHDPRFAYHPVRPRGLVPPSQQAEVPPSYVPPPPNLREPSAPPSPARVARTTPSSQPSSSKASSNHSLANAPDTTSPVPARPARTPLPRPRPEAANQQATAPAPAAPEAAPSAPQPAPRETSPEAEQPAAAPAPAAPSAAPAQPAPETQMVPVAPLD